MLKWTVINKHQSSSGNQNERRYSAELPKTTQDKSIQKSKRRKSTNSRLSTDKRKSNIRHSLNTNPDKENQFTSTPIKSEEFFHSEALRDVSNITPKDNNKLSSRVLTPGQKKLFSPKHVKHKKKKRCLDPTHGQTFPFAVPNYVEVSENLNGVDCGCKVFDKKSSTPKGISETYAPTLPTFAMEYSPYDTRTSHNILTLNGGDALKTPLLLSHIKAPEFDRNCPPYKKLKVDHVNDFLHQISFATSPENIKYDCKTEMRISPLVQKLFDLRFNTKENVEKPNDSSFINDLSLNELVNAILDSSADNYKECVSKSDINVCETNKKELESFSDKTSVDSGFRSNTDSHKIDSNFICRCKKSDERRSEVPLLNCDRTIINMDETFNERCVDEDINARKRDFSAIENCDESAVDVYENGFTLKRQKCIRRRRLMDEVKKVDFQTNGENHLANFTFCELDNNLTDNSFDSNLYEHMDDANKPSEYENSAFDESGGMHRIRRCLSFDSPVSDNSSTSWSKQVIVGSMELEVEYNSNELLLKVLKCHDLVVSKVKPVNAYIKVCLSDGRKKQQETLQRTAVQAESCRPTFNHTFRVPVLKIDLHKRLFIEVWHRDRIYRRSKFLGCMSFSVKNLIKKNIKGRFYLLPQSTGRCQNVPMTTDQISNVPDSRTFLRQDNSDQTATMCESHSSVEEVMMTADDIDGELKKSTFTNKAALSEQQKLADENLFLRYLELDPTEGPEAIPAALQRKATGNKNGRTPFTTTKKLSRQPKTGFGFSVVWTHPPRVERVEKGLPADRAGILPGDYIIFVDKHNVVMMPDIDILNLIRSYGNQLTLEIFRRNTSRNGSVPSVRRLISVGTESSTTLPAPSLSTQRRPSTVCSTTNTTSIEYNRRKLQLPQVTFSAEVGSGILV